MNVGPAGAHPAPALEVYPLLGLPEVREGDDVAALLLAALEAGGLRLVDDDVLVVSSKIVSKAAGLRAPATSRVATVLAQARRVVAERMTPSGVSRIVESLAGPVLAAAGVDASNTGEDDALLLLPHDPDGAAEAIRARLAETRRGRFGVVVSDTSGRPWRVGQTDICLGSAWVHPLDDLRGTRDADGRALSVTARAVADEIAAAADLVKGKAQRVPAALVRGSGALVGPDTPGARSLVRTGDDDWFGLGSAEAVRSALGAPPGTATAVDVGIPTTPRAAEDIVGRVERACRLATLTGALGPLPHVRPRAAEASTLDPAAVRTHITQTGVRLEAADPYLLGVVAARLLVALAGEGLPATLAERRAGDAHATVLFV